MMQYSPVAQKIERFLVVSNWKYLSSSARSPDVFTDGRFLGVLKMAPMVHGAARGFF